MAKQKSEAAYPPLRSCKTKDERVALVRRVMADGHSNLTAARALMTTVGTVAGIRFKYHIPSTRPPGGGVHVTKDANPNKSASKEDQSRPPKMAASELTQCRHIDPDNGHRCGFEKEPSSDLCKRHG